MNNNSFGQIQNLLVQVSNYVAKINEIIYQINNIINSQNQMNEMIQMNMMNNMINFPNNFNTDLNPLFNIQPPKVNNEVINIIFEYKGNFVNISANKHLSIIEVINIFFKKIGKPKLINNYMGKMKFLYNALELDYSKKVEEISQNKHFKITVVDSKNLY